MSGALQCYSLPAPVSEAVARYIQPPPAAALHIALYDAACGLPPDAAPDAAIAIISDAAPVAVAPGHLSLRAPFRLSQLQALLDSLPQPDTEEMALWHGWVLAPRNRALEHSQQEPIYLTDKEMQLLATLLKRAPDTLTRDELLQSIWDYDPAADTHTLQTHIYRLRQKLEQTQPGPQAGIITGSDGYRWQSGAR